MKNLRSARSRSSRNGRSLSLVTAFLKKPPWRHSAGSLVGLYLSPSLSYQNNHGGFYAGFRWYTQRNKVSKPNEVSSTYQNFSKPS